MTRYVDTAVLVTSLADEPRRTEMIDWLGAQPAGSLHLSWWSATEFASALSVKTRQRPDRADIFEAAHHRFQVLVASAFTVLPVTHRDFETAGQLSRQVAAGLRAGDALHLSVAAAHGLELVTLDKRMASGGAAVGVATLLR